MFSLLQSEFDKFYTINSIHGLSTSLTRRLCELGFIKGQKIKLIKKSLLGKVFLVEIRGYILSLRRNIIASIYVEK